MKSKPEAPLCMHCGKVARKTSGGEIYPHRLDLHSRCFWKCDPCGAYVGCHKGTNRPLGRPANEELRSARIRLHNDRLDPLWANADKCGIYEPENGSARWKIRSRARGRVYAYLAHELGISIDDCHVGLFDVETCRRAWVILSKTTYPDVRAWCKERENNFHQKEETA